MPRKKIRIMVRAAKSVLIIQGALKNVADRKERRKTGGILRIPAAIVYDVGKIEDFLSAG